MPQTHRPVEVAIPPNVPSSFPDLMDGNSQKVQPEVEDLTARRTQHMEEATLTNSASSVSTHFTDSDSKTRIIDPPTNVIRTPTALSIP
jgi:hypothetical protein